MRNAGRIMQSGCFIMRSILCLGGGPMFRMDTLFLEVLFILSPTSKKVSNPADARLDVSFSNIRVSLRECTVVRWAIFSLFFINFMISSSAEKKAFCNFFGCISHAIWVNIFSSCVDTFIYRI